ncbi:MAG: hypothetical protein ACO1SX_26120 [Actinomycetota bacterium]
MAALAATPPATSYTGRELALSAGTERLELRCRSHKVVFDRGADGLFHFSTEVKSGGAWRPLFDGDAPLVQGAGFDLRPTGYRVLEASPKRVAAELTGTGEREGYPWTLLVEATSGSQFLHFRLTCRLQRDMILAGLAPQFAFWMKQPALAITVNQGPGNIYQGADEKEWGNSFPAAYLWDTGREAAIFFDASPMTWMSPRNLFRFRDCRVQAWSEEQRSAFGLRVVRRNFHELSAGDVVFDAYLYAAGAPTAPTRLEALDRLVRLCAPLHPRDATLPVNRRPPHRTDWETFAAGVARNLMLPGVTWADIALPEGEPWRDAAPFTDTQVDRIRVSCDYAVESACEPRFNRTAVLQGWDFSTCNNYLSGWVGYERLRPDPRQRAFMAPKIEALPLFYDPRARLIRHGARQPLNVGDREMSWQNLMFALETVRTYRMLPPDAFRVAIPGKFLLGAEGLIELAHRNDYLLPQWFDPYEKKPLIQGDEPDLGVIYEPWQIGTYSYLMGEAYSITGEKRYLQEARAGLDRLFGGMRFKVKNDRYERDYRDPVDFPITEIFGNAWGAAAAARVHRWTGDARYQRYSDHFLNSLLRLTYWYESALQGDARDRSLHNAGLFRNQGGAYTGSPWENSEAYLAMTVRLKLDRTIREPLPRLFNLLRVNGFYFFPPVFSPEAVPCSRLAEHQADYLPIEDTYTLEHGGANGAMGRCIYMSGIAFWNYLLFEAMAAFDDPELMALNLDAVDEFEASAVSLRRHFLSYNPTVREKTALLRMRALEDGEYRVTVRRGLGNPEVRALSASSLRKGLQVTLAPDESVRIDLLRLRSDASSRALRRSQQARDAIAAAYALLQQAAADATASQTVTDALRPYRGAEAAYKKGDYRAALGSARRAIQSLPRGR